MPMVCFNESLDSTLRSPLNPGCPLAPYANGLISHVAALQANSIIFFYVELCVQIFVCVCVWGGGGAGLVLSPNIGATAKRAKSFPIPLFTHIFFCLFLSFPFPSLHSSHP